jgi:hypothetical protein
MPHRLTLRYPSAAELAAHLKQARFQDSLMLSAVAAPADLAQFQKLALQIALPDQQADLDAEVLQVLPDGSLVVRLLAAAALDALAAGDGGNAANAALPAASWSSDGTSPATAAAVAPMAEPARSHTGPAVPVGAGPMSWPIEKLQNDWDQLSTPDKINVAKHGTLAARRMIMKMQDRQLHQFVLANPGLTSDEVAAIASMTNLAPELLKLIANKPEWTRNQSVVRNLICHPKLPQDVVTRLLGLLPDLELRKLARTGRVRDSVKRLIIKKVEL